MMVQTTSHCNASCVFCPYPDTKDELPQGRMSQETFEKIVQDCKPYSDQLIYVRPYLMNEPLLDNTLFDKIKYLKEQLPNTPVQLMTNGSLLSRKMARQMVDSGVDHLGIGFHSLEPEMYEKIMVGLKYDRTLKCIDSFVSELQKIAPQKLNSMLFIFCVMSHPMNTKLFAEYWKNRGIDRTNFVPGPLSRAGNVRNLRRPLKKKINGCLFYAGNNIIHILYNGDVILCNMDWRREVVLGNVKDQSIYDIWNGSEYRTVLEMIEGRRESPDDFICKRCEEAFES
jgi:radical SAM protein with 4Fe4S-binding SPASM domain